jgi:hypothetical protein
METWLNESFSSQHFFPEIYTYAKLRDGVALHAVSQAVLGVTLDSTLNIFKDVYG